MLCHTNLFLYYKKIFVMAQHHDYSIAEIENMLPFERDIYFDMLSDYIKQLEEQQQNSR